MEDRAPAGLDGSPNYRVGDSLRTNVQLSSLRPSSTTVTPAPLSSFQAQRSGDSDCLRPSEPVSVTSCIIVMPRLSLLLNITALATRPTGALLAFFITRTARLNC